MWVALNVFRFQQTIKMWHNHRKEQTCTRSVSCAKCKFRFQKTIKTWHDHRKMSHMSTIRNRYYLVTELWAIYRCWYENNMKTEELGLFICQYLKNNICDIASFPLITPEIKPVATKPGTSRIEISRFKTMIRRYNLRVWCFCNPWELYLQHFTNPKR